MKDKTVRRLIIQLLIFLLFAELSLRYSSLPKPWDSIEEIIRPTEIKTNGSQKNETESKRTEYEVKRNLTGVNFQPKVPHPYFGHVYNRSKDARVNRDGFLDSNDFQLINSNDPHKYYIGIFGGSVAKEFALTQSWKKENNADGLATKLKKNLPDLFGAKEIVIINFGVSAYKQPQQFIVSSFYSKKINMAITIDGYNEISHPYWNTFRSDFPSYSNLFYSLNPARNKYISNLYDLMVHRINLAQSLNGSSVVKKSYILGWSWKIYDTWISKKINQIHYDFNSKTDIEFPYYDFDNEKTEDEKAFELASIWEEFTWKQHKVLSSENVKDFYFIQPNQHVSNSKKLTDEEFRLFYEPERSEWLNLGYTKLRANAVNLKNRGLKVYDLTNIFFDVDKTVYSDACCHLNTLGNDILEENITKIISDYFLLNNSSDRK